MTRYLNRAALPHSATTRSGATKPRLRDVAGIRLADDGRITETFTCGTALAVVSVGHVVSPQREWPVGDGTAGPVTARLLEALHDIQFGQTPDEFG